jgi:hypothetical protein
VSEEREARVRIAARALLLGLALAALACASTRLQDTWRNPDAGPLRFHKVVVLAITSDAALRRTIEDEIVRQATRGDVVAGYSFIPDADLRDTDKVRELVKARGFDGAFVFLLEGVEKQQSYLPAGNAMPGYSLWGYYGYGWSSAIDPINVRTDTFVRVESRVYSVLDEQLVWSGRSETLNPSSVQELVKGVIDAVAAELRRQGLIPEPAATS